MSAAEAASGSDIVVAGPRGSIWAFACRNQILTIFFEKNWREVVTARAASCWRMKCAMSLESRPRKTRVTLGVNILSPLRVAPQTHHRPWRNSRRRRRRRSRASPRRSPSPSRVRLPTEPASFARPSSRTRRNCCTPLVSREFYPNARHPPFQPAPQASTSTSSAATPSSSCLLYTSPSPRDGLLSRMPSSA